MPVRVEYRTRNEGWKAGENGRFGMVAVAVFKDAASGQRLFEWAPTLGDCNDMELFCNLVESLDRLNKQLYAMKKTIEEINKPENAVVGDACECNARKA